MYSVRQGHLQKTFPLHSFTFVHIHTKRQTDTLTSWHKQAQCGWKVIHCVCVVSRWSRWAVRLRCVIKERKQLAIPFDVDWKGQRDCSTFSLHLDRWMEGEEEKEEDFSCLLMDQLPLLLEWLDVYFSYCTGWMALLNSHCTQWRISQESASLKVPPLLLNASWVKPHTNRQKFSSVLAEAICHFAPGKKRYTSPLQS